MKYRLHILILSLFALTGTGAQNDSISDQTHTHYREDQFYVGINYNLLGNNTQDISQNGFSFGFQTGFLRDMPINEAGTMAVALGLGYSANSVNQNMLISDLDGVNNYTIVSNTAFTKNRFSFHLVEVPLELRWRTSAPDVYKFWRIYAGLKVGYVLSTSAKHEGDIGSVKINELRDIRRWQYGLTLSVGYNTMNLHAYYGLHKLFNSSATLNGESLNVRLIRLGLTIYIL